MRRNYWTKEKCHQISLRYKTKKDFKKNDSCAYHTASKNQWINYICSHMIPFRHAKWIKEDCAIEALKYKSKVEFENSAAGAYNSALRNKWIDDICTHMKPLGNRFKRLVYVYIFPDNHFYTGLTFNMIERDTAHKRDRKNRNSSVFKHIKKTGLMPILIQSKLISVEEAVILEGKMVKKYKAKNYIALNKVKTGALGSSTLKWNFENCKKEAKKYISKSEFIKKAFGAYESASSRGWLEEICEHMAKLRQPDGYWTKEKCLKEAKKYKSALEMDKNSPGAYKSSKRNKWLSEIGDILKKNKKHLNENLGNP